jgi:hypothetical protein
MCHTGFAATLWFQADQLVFFVFPRDQDTMLVRMVCWKRGHDIGKRVRTKDDLNSFEWARSPGRAARVRGRSAVKGGSRDVGDKGDSMS